MGDADRPAALRLNVVYSPSAGVIDACDLTLPVGATVAQALRESGLQSRHPALDLAAAPVGVWGALCDLSQVLRHGDRVEVYRALRVDPKEARRERYRKDPGFDNARR